MFKFVQMIHGVIKLLDFAKPPHLIVKLLMELIFMQIIIHIYVSKHVLQVKTLGVKIQHGFAK